MLLCPFHHDATTKGALLEDAQRAAKAAPRNLREGLVMGELAINQSYLAVSVGVSSWLAMVH